VPPRRPESAGQATRRHPEDPPYRCCLSALTGFEGLRRAGPTRTLASRIIREPEAVNRLHGFRTCETSGRCPSRADSTGCFTRHPPPARSPPTPEGRSRQEPGTMCAGRSRWALSAIPLAVGRRSHAGGSSAPLRSAPRRGASRGWGFEAALRRTARSPVVTRTVSHGSEPIHRLQNRTEQGLAVPLTHAAIGGLDGPPLDARRPPPF